MPGAIIMAVVFTILTITHLTLIVQNGKKFMIPILVGGICRSPTLPSPFLLAGLGMRDLVKANVLIVASFSRNHRIYLPRHSAQ